MPRLVHSVVPSLLVLACLWSLHPPACPSQRLLWEQRGTVQTPVGDAFSYTVAGILDVDGDGIPDVVVGADSTFADGMYFSGKIYVFSGRDGRPIHSIPGTRDRQGLGIRIASVGDVTGDGAGDFLVQDYDTTGFPRQTLYAGRTGTPVRAFPRYATAAGVGDVTGDGVPDFVLSNPGATVSGMQYAGQADLVSGRTFTVVRSFTGDAPLQGFGGPVAFPGDIDGDGVPDLVFWGSGGLVGLSRRAHSGVWAYSGRTGSLIYRIPPGLRPTDTFPTKVVAGEFNGDGLADIVLSDLGDRRNYNYTEVTAFAGPLAHRLWSLRSSRPEPSLGYNLAVVGDVNGDAHDDVLMRGVYGLFLLSGATGAVLSDLSNLPGVMSAGLDDSLAALGDVNGDDFPDLLIGNFVYLPSDVRAVRVYSGAPDGVDTLGIGCPDGQGVIPRIGASFHPRPGNPFAVNLARVPPGRTALLLLGISNSAWGSVSLPMDLGPVGMPGCSLLVAGDVVLPFTTRGPGKGQAVANFPLPPDPALSASTFYAQWVVLEPPSATGPAGQVTRALRVTVQ